ncbi:MAG TPA: indole-3-glycerol phosphate synthase TrpC [Gemmatimonadales bacterium]|nr:indole-3-glycerol phosphate synthase TrpC [Gemmatimonadales bacterium]
MNLPEHGPKGKSGDVLAGILAETRTRIPALRLRQAELERAAAARPDPPSFRAALRAGDGLALIAEVKRRSPSEGVISSRLDPVAHARSYAAAGARAISVLTEPTRFGGSIDDLEAVVARVPTPVLRKDFIVDEIQLVEARAAGAAAVLLIVRALSARELPALLRAANGLGLGTLVEAHSALEVDAALEAGAMIIGVNSRDLADLRIDRDAAWALLARVPADRVAVAESGIASAADAAQAAAAGADAVLVGSALSRSASPAPLVASIVGVPRRGR